MILIPIVREVLCIFILRRISFSMTIAAFPIKSHFQSTHNHFAGFKFGKLNCREQL